MNASRRKAAPGRRGPSKRATGASRGSTASRRANPGRPTKTVGRRRPNPASTATADDRAAHQPGPEPLQPVDPKGMRLQRFIAQAGLASRRKAESLIEDGHVRVNGKVVRELGTRVDPERDQVSVSGRRISAQALVYYLLNKPDGCVCSTSGTKDELGRPTVLTHLPGIQQRVFPVGRLDFHSRGLLILTNDGALSARLTHPSSPVLMVYHVKFQGQLTQETLQTLKKGVRLEDGTVTRPAEELLVVKETAQNTWVQIGITQNLNHQIRRMGTAVGHEVIKLIRVGIGDMVADDLEEGRFRRLTATEVAGLLGWSDENSPKTQPHPKSR